jgi:hypothetical protein
MNPSPPPRLPWQPHPEGGFIAYPEGWTERPERFARMQPTISGGYGVYSWSVHYDGQAISDVVDDKQRASDAANDAWPRVVEMAKAAGAKSEWERHQIEMIGKLERGELDPHYFANEAASYDNLMFVMDRVKNKRPLSLQIERLIDALSREFHRRRQK